MFRKYETILIDRRFFVTILCILFKKLNRKQILLRLFFSRRRHNLLHTPLLFCRIIIQQIGNGILLAVYNEMNWWGNQWRTCKFPFDDFPLLFSTVPHPTQHTSHSDILLLYVCEQWKKSRIDIGLENVFYLTRWDSEFRLNTHTWMLNLALDCWKLNLTLHLVALPRRKIIHVCAFVYSDKSRTR